MGANLRGADLRLAYLKWANLSGVDLRGADLGGADLQMADLSEADLSVAVLWDAKLVAAVLLDADLSSAVLGDADLSGTRLSRANIENAKFFGVDLTDAWYEPASAPAKGHLSGLRGLTTVKFRQENHSGLVLLRKALEDAGLRRLEREATFAIEHGKALHARQSDSLGEQFGGWLQLICFEWTTG